MIPQSSSEQSICFVVPESAEARVLDELRKGFEHELVRRDIERIFATPGVVVVTVVGAAILTTPGIAGRIFTAVGEGFINVLAIAMGSSECRAIRN